MPREDRAPKASGCSKIRSDGPKTYRRAGRGRPAGLQPPTEQIVSSYSDGAAGWTKCKRAGKSIGSGSANTFSVAVR
jgi:hypothetical protein